MAATTSAAVGLLLILLLVRSALGASPMYCGEENCYSVLGVSISADTAEVKRAYRKLALKYHPDKNNDPAAVGRFQLVAAAYETLSDSELRAAYDYSLEHPEEHLYNQYRYYRAHYQPQTPLWTVVLGILSFVSMLQYTNRRTLHNSYMDSVTRTVQFKQRLLEAQAAMARERGVRPAKLTPKDQTHCFMECMQAVEVDDRPPARIQDTVLVQCVALPLRTLWWLLYSIVNWREISRRRRASQEAALAELRREEAEREGTRLAKEERERQRLQGKQQRLEQQEEERRCIQQRVQEKAERRMQEAASEENLQRRRQAARQSLKQQLSTFLAESSVSCDVARADHSVLGQHLSLDELESLVRLLGEEGRCGREEEIVRGLEDAKRRVDEELQRRRENEERRRSEAAAHAREEERRSKEAWTPEECGRLAKALQRYPGGVPKRWELVARFVETRTERQCTEKAKDLAKAPAPA